MSHANFKRIADKLVADREARRAQLAERRAHDREEHIDRETKRLEVLKKNRRTPRRAGDD